MEITKLWNISDNVLFYLAIAVVFVVATIIEVRRVSQYLDKTKAAINFLSHKKGEYVKVSPWLHEHLDPEDINIVRQKGDKNCKFIFIKYPSKTFILSSLFGTKIHFPTFNTNNSNLLKG